MLDDLLAKFARRDRLALSRLITLVSRGEQLGAIRAAVSPLEKRGVVIALTGSAGVGKSTLIGKLTGLLRDGGQTVAVIACDPQSPITGGALLGDRIRMSNVPDEGRFIRSLAVASGQQSIAANLDLIIGIVRAFGFDFVLLETVGAGQGDTAVRNLADKVVLLVQPETGDELQWEKAGVLEIADVVVVHKSDLAGSENTVAQLRQLLHLPGCRPVPVIAASSTNGAGLDELCAAIQSSNEPSASRSAN